MSLLAGLKFEGGWMKDGKEVVGLITNWRAFSEEGQRQPAPGFKSEVEVLGS